VGVKYIVFLGLIPLDLIPMYYDKSVNTKRAFNKLVKYYNSVLIETLNQFQAEHSDVQASYFDTYQLFETAFSQKELERNARMDCGGNADCGE